MKEKIFEGAATALYTPFTDGLIDYTALNEAIERQISGKIDALVILGTTGEAPTVTDKERFELIKFTVSAVRGRVPVIVGSGSNSTQKYVEYTNLAKELGADASLAVTPFYNKCSQEGLFRHYEAAEKACAFPTIVYNVPSRTGFKIKPETYACLSQLKHIVGIKEADGDINHVVETFEKVDGEIPVYCGTDELNYEFFKLGASGTISVLSNVIPCKIHDYYFNFKNNYENKKTKKVEVFEKLSKLLFVSVNPIPLKALVEKIYKKGYELRLPLCELPEEEKENLVLEFNKLLKEI